MTPVLANGNWTLKVPRLLRKLTVLMDSGQLNVSSDNVTGADGENMDRQLRNLQGTTDESAEAEDMDTIILGSMMRKDPHVGE